MPLKTGDVTDVKATEGSVLDGMGKVIAVLTLQFKVRDQGPFTISVPKQGFSAEAGTAAMRSFAEQIVKCLEGHC